MSSEDRRVPLSVDRHSGRFWRRFTSYDFARGLRVVPLAMAEAEPVAAAMPILFADGAQGVEPQALLRVVPGGDSAFVSPAGLWLATYVPSMLRVHPFSARPAGDGRMVLLVDETSGMVTDDPGDEPFFGPDGAPAAATAGLVDFFRQREASALKARTAAARLQALGLLQPFAPAAPEVPEGTWGGFSVVDRARWDGLDDATHLELRALGAVALVHAHLVSLTQVAWLHRAEALRDAAPGIAAAAPAAPEPARGIDDFLAALAVAQADDGLPSAPANGGAPSPDDPPAAPPQDKPH